MHAVTVKSNDVKNVWTWDDLSFVRFQNMKGQLCRPLALYTRERDVYETSLAQL